MRRSFKILGIALMIIAFVFMFTFIIIPAVIPSFDALPPLKATYQVLFCKADETLAEKRTLYRPSPGTTVTTIDLGCTNRTGQSRDIGQEPIAVGAGGYFATFLPGLFIFMAASSKRKQPYNVADHADSLQQLQEASRAARKDMGLNAQLEGTKSATARLEELKSALNEGLITQAEYESKRQEILREM